MASNVSTPKGTRDFNPIQEARRKYIIQVISQQFDRFGFYQIETPAMENLNTLTGKYGDEGDQLLFKILNSGDFLGKIKDDKILSSKDSKAITPWISEKGLRYDLTVPFARFVVQNQNDINFPFKRYQIQPVWRADRPQKGRFREFYQCDADVVGSSSLWQEVEFTALYCRVFDELQLPVTIKINHRKILAGIAECANIEGNLSDFTVALDKLDKIGPEKVLAELNTKGIEVEALQKMDFLFEPPANNTEMLEKLEQMLSGSEIGMQGVQELKFVVEQYQKLKLQQPLQIDITLARGLSYYTGCIFEVKANDIDLGSIGGGGRYDDLTGIFGLKDLSGVGISFGLDRIYIALEEKNLFPEAIEQPLQLLFLNLGEKEMEVVFPIMMELREAGHSIDFYPDSAKMKKQMNYANQQNVPYIGILGSTELKENSIQIKNMQDGSQQSVVLNADSIAKALKG